MAIFTSVTQNVQMVQCDRHSQWATFKILDQDVSIRPLLDQSSAYDYHSMNRWSRQCSSIFEVYLLRYVELHVRSVYHDQGLDQLCWRPDGACLARIHVRRSDVCRHICSVADSAPVHAPMHDHWNEDADCSHHLHLQKGLSCAFSPDAAVKTVTWLMPFHS